MSKYKVGDKVVMEILRTDDDGYYEFGNDNRSLWWFGTYINEISEPLSTYTEPLEAKIKRQAAEITRLLAENKRLKAENEKMEVKLDTYELYGDQHEEEYNQASNQGAEAAWELARKIVLENGYSAYDLHEIFNCCGSHQALEDYTYLEAAAKVAEWEKAKEEIKVGDVFQDDDGNNAIVTSIKGNTVYYMWDDGDTRSGFVEDVKKHFTKTGRHIDIDSFLKQIGSEE